MKKIFTIIFLVCLLPFPGRSQVPIVSRPDAGRDVERIAHDGYISCYNHVTLQPDWVCWELTPDMVVYDGPVHRSDQFLPDPLAHGPMATTQSYTRTGYDRGHMAPAADFRYDQKAQDETFYMSNICLQDHTLNEKTWCELEKRTRYWANLFYKTTLWIAAGPVFTTYENKVGKDNLPVPAGFWKVVCRVDEGTFICIGFLFPNKPISDDWKKYAVPVDRVEEITGFDFYPGLETHMDESSFDLRKWK